MTIFEKIKSMSEEEMADWLASQFDYDSIVAPWDDFFYKEYCSKCEHIQKETSIGHLYTVNYCEENKCCRFFPNEGLGVPDIRTTVKIWLKSDGTNCFTTENKQYDW